MLSSQKNLVELFLIRVQFITNLGTFQTFELSELQDLTLVECCFEPKAFLRLIQYFPSLKNFTFTELWIECECNENLDDCLIMQKVLF